MPIDQELLVWLELTIEQWDDLTEWQQYEKLGTLYREQQGVISNAHHKIRQLEDEILHWNYKIMEAEEITKPALPILTKMRQNLLIDPCPGQLPIEWPKSKKRRKSA
jgi:hypothetical protein